MWRMQKMMKEEDKYGLFDDDLPMLKFWCSGVLLQTKFLMQENQNKWSPNLEANLSKKSSFKVWA